MNYFDLAFIVIAILMVIAGAKRGLVVSLLSMLKYVIGIPISFFLSDMFYQRFYDSYVRDILYKSVYNKLSESQSAEGLIDGVRELVDEIPDFFTGSLDISSLNGLTIEQISKNFTDTVLEPIILTVLKILIFVVSFVIFCIILNILISVFTKLQKKKHMPLKHTNSLLGGVFGFVKALVFIFTVATIIGYICNIIPQDNSFIKQADSSIALEFINTNNPLLN